MRIPFFRPMFDITLGESKFNSANEIISHGVKKNWHQYRPLTFVFLKSLQVWNWEKCNKTKKYQKLA